LAYSNSKYIYFIDQLKGLNHDQGLLISFPYVLIYCAYQLIAFRLNFYLGPTGGESVGGVKRCELSP